MTTFQQAITLLKKNMIVSVRNWELVVEIALPIVVALMLALKDQLAAIGQLMPLLYSLAITAPQRSLLIHLVEEKSQRYKEVQKIMGMNENAYTMGWVLTGYLRITIAMAVFLTSYYAFMQICNTQWDNYFTSSFTDLMWVYIVFGYAAINQIFLLSALFSDIKLAGEMQSFLSIAVNFFVYFTFVKAVAETEAYYIFLTILSPQCGASFSYVTSMKKEEGDIDLLKINLFPIDIINDTFSVESAGIVLSILILAYFLLFLYCEQVIPNEYGISKHPLFFLKSNKQKHQVEAQCINNSSGGSKDISSALYHEDLFMKEPPTITINGLLKQFRNYTAVNNISLQLYESQIFCLLGHNGAGKTTAINLLTGMIQKTAGDVTMYGMQLDKQLDQIRRSLGLCNQKDCLYQELTVYEHLQFISGIKGSIDQEEITNILQKTELTGETDKKVKVLSGGSKRKLSLAMALVGNSKIIFLDEPTSGMDAFSRRSIWDILERIKADNRTIILTTHHLDEAEILANRIGIMSRGQLLAVGTSEFIKRKFGEGYRLTVKFQEGAIDKNEIKNDIFKSIQNVVFEQEYSNNTQLTFIIPFTQQRFLADLFEKLEQKPVKIGLKMNTLEDAFVKIGLEEEEEQLEREEEDAEHQVEKEEGLSASQDQKLLPTSIEQEQIQDFPPCLKNPPQYMFLQQVLAIFYRRLYTVIRTSTNYFAILIPVITFILGLTTVFSVDLDEVFKDQDNVEIALEFFKISLISSCSVLGFCFNSTIYITLPVQEKEFYLKQTLQGMGCRTLPYWLGTFLFDYLIYSLFIILFFVYSAIIGLDLAFKYWEAGLLSFVCFGFSQILLAYVMGFVFTKLETALKLYAIFCFFIQFCLPFMFMAFLDYFYQQFDRPTSFKYVMEGIQVLFACVSPYYSFFEAYTFVSGTFEQLGNVYSTPQFSSNSFLFCYIMMGQIVVLSLILFILEKKKTLNIVNKKTAVNGNSAGLEQDVIQERDRILNGQVDDPIQAKLVEKEYLKNQPTLQQLTFGVKQSEIFGIIGPNGAGKSTLINTFTGFVIPTKGKTQIKGAQPSQQKMNIMQHVGICPQFDCIWENLTPVEHLNLFGRIKGLKGKELQTAVEYFIETMQLGLFRKRQAGKLSGGNKRKLCVADALIGGSDITFFDEPSTGVDPISRRFLFNTLKRNVQLRNCSAIMTTHTIEEAESLSQRIGILIAGQFRCIGSPQYLREKYGSGYQVTFKCKGNQEDVEKMIYEFFPSSKRMEDKRYQYMSFTLSDENFSFFKTFKFFENRQDENLIEEFQISQSSLEQIFILFSKIQQELNEQAGVLFD